MKRQFRDSLLISQGNFGFIKAANVVLITSRDKEKVCTMKEKELFNWLKDRFLPDLEATDQFDYKDAYSKEHDLYIELKCRKTHYDDLLIESIKWNKLIEHKNARYINWTPKGIYSFNIQEIPPPTWHVRLMPQTTEFENTDMIPKVVAMLNISSAKEISRI